MRVRHARRFMLVGVIVVARRCRAVRLDELRQVPQSSGSPSAMLPAAVAEAAAGSTWPEPPSPGSEPSIVLVCVIVGVPACLWPLSVVSMYCRAVLAAAPVPLSAANVGVRAGEIEREFECERAHTHTLVHTLSQTRASV